jgi:hypothetical protein
LIFAFVLSPITFAWFDDISSQIVNRFLSADNDAVSALSAAIVIVYVQHKRSEVQFEPIGAFLCRALRQTPNTMAVRMAGALSSFLEGALFLDGCDLFTALVPRLSSSHEAEMNLAMLVFASAAAHYPMSKAMLHTIPLFFKRITGESRETCWTFLANICINPQGAVECARHFGAIVAALAATDYEVNFRVLTVVLRIVSCAEGLTIVDSTKNMTDLVQVTKGMWNSDLNDIVFRVYEAISALKRGRKALQDAQYPAFISAKARDCSQQQLQVLLRTLSRLSRRKG